MKCSYLIGGKIVSKKTTEQMLEEYKRRSAAGEFQREYTKEDLEGVDPCSLKYMTIMCALDPEYEQRLFDDFHKTNGLYVEGLY